MNSRQGELVTAANGVWAHMLPPGNWGQTNTGLVIGDGESLVVDTVWDVPRALVIEASYARLTSSAPIRTAVNTHADGDHWWGNDYLPADATIVTSQRALDSMQADLGPSKTSAIGNIARVAGHLPGRLGLATRYSRVVLGGAQFPRSTPRLPDQTFDVEQVLTVGGREVRLRRLGPAHTSGDLIVHVPDADVVFGGDLLFIGTSPVLWHGPLASWIAALDYLLDLNAASYVPGHGHLATRADVEKLRDYWLMVSDAAHRGFDSGASAAVTARQLMVDPAFGPFASWLLPERLTISMHQIFGQLRGAKPGDATLAQRFTAFADAERLRQELMGG